MEQSFVNLLPRSRVVRWLTGSAVDVPADLRAGLLLSYLTSVPSLVSGTAANLAVNIVATVRHPTSTFYTLLAIDLLLIVIRLGLLRSLRRAAATGTRGPTDLFVFSSIAWSLLLGAVTCVCFTSGDPILQVAGTTSMIAMVGGIATRNYGLPRLAILQIVALDLPYTVAALFWPDPWMLVVVAQSPLYIIAMKSAVFRLHAAYLTVAMAERENDRRATHDALTGLRNRPGLLIDLSQSELCKDRFALLYLDLDGFKAINDVLGHAAGDRLLQLVANRLEKAMPPGSIVARLGGDEFVILVPGVVRDQAEAIGGTAIRVTSEPYDLGVDQPATIGASIGVVCAEPNRSAEDLLARADAALYRAKADGKGRLVVASDATAAAPHETRKRAA